MRRKQVNEAEAEYRTALRLDPKFVPAMANLADLDRERGMDKEGAELLRAAIAIEPDNAAIKHSLGLLLVRQRNYAEALPLFREAAALAPDNARYVLVTLITLERDGRNLTAALSNAQELAALEPGNAQISALVDDLRRRLGR
jgi:tetratricopeptide (TPR) repeat protein